MAHVAAAAAEILALARATCHAIPVRARDVTVLATPPDFLAALLAGIGSARSRLSIATLYVGTGVGPGAQSEASLVSALGAAAARPGLRVRVVLDALRGTRVSPIPAPPAPAPGEPPPPPRLSSARLLAAQLLAQLPAGDVAETETAAARVRVGLYHTPALRGPLRTLLPDRYNEVLGVCHVKAMAWDDTVLLTGANLSREYLTTRQDRYLLIQRAGPLASLVHALVGVLSSGGARLGRDGRLDWFMGDTAPDPTMGDDEYSDGEGGILSPSTPLSPTRWIHPLLSPGQHRVQLAASLQAIMAPSSTPSSLPWAAPAVAARASRLEASGSPLAWVCPAMQVGPAGVIQAQQLTTALLHTCASGGPGARLALASAYLNLAPPYEGTLAAAVRGSQSASVDLLTAAPQANGFYGASGIAGAVPATYAVLASRLHRRLAANAPRGRLTLLEYARPGWQFHAKGLWYAPPPAALSPPPPPLPPPGPTCWSEDPVATLVGSSNLGQRSLRRDVETDFLIVTADRGLRAQLGAERAALAEHASPPAATARHGMIASACATLLAGWL